MITASARKARRAARWSATSAIFFRCSAVTAFVFISVMSATVANGPRRSRILKRRCPSSAISSKVISEWYRMATMGRRESSIVGSMGARRLTVRPDPGELYAVPLPASEQPGNAGRELDRPGRARAAVVAADPEADLEGEP